MFLLILIIIIWFLINILTINKTRTFYTNIIGGRIILFIIITRFWKLYIIYEISIIPISIIIIGWGYNPYRFPASLYIIMYAVLFSLPSIVLILYNRNFNINLELNNMRLNILRKLIILLIFILKIPVFFFHYWLPKAHVEASTLGSVVLASGLLKIGGYGFIKILQWFNFIFFNFSIFLLIRLYPTIICLLQTDLKKIIAYISISHITLGLSRIICIMNIRLKRYLFINIIHILTRGRLFYIRGIFFSLRKRRLIHLIPSLFNKKFFILYVLIVLLNISTPPFFSFIREFILIRNIFCKTYLNFIFIILFIIIRSLYSVFLINRLKFYKSIRIKLISIISLYFLLLIAVLIWFILC